VSVPADLLVTATFARDPLAALRRLRAQRGEVFALKMAFAGRAVVVCDPTLVAALLESDPGGAHAGAARRAVLPMASERSVLGGDEETHAAHRGALAPVFAAEALAARRGEIAAIARRHADAWPRGRPVALLPRLRALVDEVFARIVLGVADERRAGEIAAALGAMLRTPGNPPLPPPGAEEGPLGAIVGVVFERRRRRFAGLLAEEIERRRQGAAADARPDAVAALLSAPGIDSTAEIVDELVTLAMAAQEPPSIALGWMLDRLARHPALAADYLAAGDGSPLREAVLTESLRLRPSALAVLRRLTRPLDAGGHALGAGDNALLPLPLLHRDPARYEDPDVFRPARWLGDAVPPPTFLPFGAGARGCLGEPLARAEGAAIVPAVLEAVELRPLWPRTERMVLRGTVLAPHRSLPVVVGSGPNAA
jgi:cytochrome P450 family 135